MKHRANVLASWSLLRCSGCSLTLWKHFRMRLNPSVKQNFIPLFDMKSVLLIAAIALCASTAAQAQGSTGPAARPAGPPSQTSHSQVAPSGAAAAGPAKQAASRELEAAFRQTDTNGDGKLSKKEAEAFPELLQLFTEIDTDHDSFVSSKEFKIASGG